MEISIDMEIDIFSLPKDNIARLNKQTNTPKSEIFKLMANKNILP